MRGLVWGRTYEVGKRMLESVKNDYLLSGYEIVEEINNSSSNYIIFNNGDVWKAVSPRNSTRGNKANLSYVDSNITDELALSIIRNCTIAKPWNAIKIIYGA